MPTNFDAPLYQSINTVSGFRVCSFFRTKILYTYEPNDTTMMKRSRYGIILGLILVLGVFIAGCSSQPSVNATAANATTANTTTSNTTATTTTAFSGVQFVAGDIAAKTSTSTDTFWLILDYDKATDQYVRALIFKNTDGSWGHRTDNRTEKSPRATMQKVYPVKIAHVTISSVPVVTPTVPTTVPTTLSGSGPSISNITPTSGAVGSTVTMTISGSGFVNGATAKMVQAGYSPVTATGVSVSSTSISCTFSLGSLQKGYASVRVTNPDGQSGALENVFSIGEAGPVIASFSPITGGLNQTYALTLTGQNFKDPVIVKLTKASSEDIICTSPVVTGTGTIKCNVAIGSGPIGDWTVTVKNIAGGLSGTGTQMFKVTNSTA